MARLGLPPRRVDGEANVLVGLVDERPRLPLRGQLVRGTSPFALGGAHASGLSRRGDGRLSDRGVSPMAWLAVSAANSGVRGPRMRFRTPPTWATRSGTTTGAAGGLAAGGWPAPSRSTVSTSVPGSAGARAAARVLDAVVGFPPRNGVNGEGLPSRDSALCW